MNAISISSATRAPSNRFLMLRIIALLLFKFLRAGICDGEFRMRYLRAALITSVLFGHCSCTVLSGDSDVSKSEQIRCQVGPDCDLKWERAYTWVVESSGLKLKTKTDGLIKTAESPGNDRTLIVTITKNSTWQSGIYEIDFIGKCLSIWSCTPSVAESRTSFANFVSAAD